MIYTASAASVIRQSVKGHEIMREMDRFAREIGCRVFGDEVIASADQGRKLDEKWNELNKRK